MEPSFFLWYFHHVLTLPAYLLPALTETYGKYIQKLAENQAS